MIDQFIALVKRSPQHQFFYHFTDRRNIDSIRRSKGLYSRRHCREAGIDIAAPGGNDWSFDADERSGMDAYVHLSFTMGNPMCHIAQQSGRIAEVVWLRVSPEVLRLPGAMITDDVSNQSGIYPKNITEALQQIDQEIIYQRTNWRDPVMKSRLDKADRYEIIVPKHIPISYIEKPNG